ncbi:MAG: cell division protein BolA [Thalassobium sp.]|jgi:acid stress-induced BolA-like protein IbaG/YrbA|uniref:BolA/IbaG family iron-sulfur metabolism protein n=2 Tax=Thalassolituus TaxID=187492 RepID=A0A9X2WH10_9GAMM|nr:MULTISPECIES: BolA/IbaG family iron-sulfur metabolism protein [Thalassolituus]MAY14204.1 cell division protein BolA [Oceanospirillaceae bacterium]MBU2038060.1 BolA/IbaG family iron-sulfur metabolism protein [Gammaproteobacteria bacterium]MCD8523582.1 BolA/IbaG family iron-sulfur metabolism protein [Saccharospirillaceae bacterium]PHS62419.1 MAG: cell division protein BolA [Thalassobium sp.]PIQ39597.1 MAG: cell division protein BolA [Thalassolituus sp. CG17_big_fil_post_rev_8_21_14_2_50_53_8]|tara:strand:+ start:513 stop:746 length:234 start_codon:yes stop_codon:yes gene_type:complete
MSPAEILQILQTESPEVSWHVDGDGYKYEVEAVGDVFDGLNAVKRQQFVYRVLNPYIADGRIHAVTIRTYTPAEKAE